MSKTYCNHNHIWKLEMVSMIMDMTTKTIYTIFNRGSIFMGMGEEEPLINMTDA